MKHRILESRQDTLGTLEVIEQGGEIALHFGNHTEQSAWRPDQPDRLSFAYYRAMMLALAVHPDPARIGILGLGGGAMAKFLIEHTESSIHTVELRKALGPIAARHFGLDLHHPRLSMAFADITAPDWQPGWSNADVILVDVFDEDGMVTLPDSTVTALVDSLDEDGLVCLNVWRNTMQAVVQVHRQLSAHCHPDALVAHVPERMNSVLIYRKRPWRGQDLEDALRRLRHAPKPLRRAQAEAWQWLQPLRGPPRNA
jgi:spermidine synthase